MAQPYVGEIRLFAGNFAPAGWNFCEGQLLPISENETLFQVIGTTYGGDGQSTFALPDLRGRIPVHQGNGMIMGQNGGTEQETLTVNQIQGHSHQFLGSSENALQAGPEGRTVAAPTVIDLFRGNPPSATFAAQSVGPVGGSQPHENVQPFLCLNYIISLFGIFPSPS